MTIAVDLGRKATKQTNKMSQDERSLCLAKCSCLCHALAAIIVMFYHIQV